MAERFAHALEKKVATRLFALPEEGSRRGAKGSPVPRDGFRPEREPQASVAHRAGSAAGAVSAGCLTRRLMRSR